MGWVEIAVSILGILILPLMALLFRMVIKFTRVEDKLDVVITDMKELVLDKNKTHAEIAATMREDRQATDRRLRWLEEHVWRGQK
jgi:hypothetical protein